MRHAVEPAYNKKGKCYRSEHTSHPAQGLNRLTIAQQISLLAGVAVLALVVILALSLVRVQRVSDLIGEISSATSEQTTGISQVGEAVTQLDQVTQQNAALVEQSAAAADSLRHQAAKLAEVVSVFRLAS